MTSSVEGICSGYTLKGQALQFYWNSSGNDCPSAFATTLNTLPNGTSGYNPTNLPVVQSDVKNLFTNYLSTNIITDNTQDPRYSSFQNNLLQLCTD